MTRQHTRAIGWTVALAAIVAFSLLGHWQLQRMQYKQALLEQAEHVREREWGLADALRARPALRWVQGEGRFLPALVLLDNQLHQGQAGIRVYQPFLATGAAQPLLVDLGWLPLPGDRRLPQLAPLAGGMRVRGLLAAPPSAGLAMGPALAPTDVPGHWLASRLDLQAIGKALGCDLSSQVLRLDPALHLGYARDLDLLPNTLPPARHLAYAVQWFGLALAVLVLALVLEWRRRRSPGPAP